MSQHADPSADRRTRVQDAFARAAETPTLARAAMLARLRAEDPAVADEVESLLKYHGAPVPDADWLAQPGIAGVIGASIGGCTAERLIGFGGMSMVYAATEQFPRRKVALKLVRPERLSVSAQRRLRVEAEALARLEHPNIARVFAAGVHRLASPDGGAAQEFPYIVMELVADAKPLTRFANDRALGVRDRILLVALIADAVEHAHRAGVIHRDLKPGNVLVGADGVPKIIDFGIAAVRDSTVTAATEGPMGTLAYMSPEQARGRDTDTRSDVWGLGALLYDLLAGRPPFDAPEGSLAQHLDRLLQGSIERVAPLVAARLGESARQDLPAATDAVLRMALAPEPAGRYQSAAEFADELRNLLDGLPLRARADSPIDSLLRAARRHRRAIAVSAGFALVVATALVLVSVALARTKSANERAQWSSYVAAITAASGLLDQGDGSAAWKMLESAPSEHRGWEWHALARRADPATARIEFGRQSVEGSSDPRGRLNQVYDLAYSADGSTLFVAATSYLAALDTATLRDRWRTERAGGFVAWRHRPLAGGGSVAVDYDQSLLRLDAKGAVLRTRPMTAVAFLATDAAQRRVFFGAGASVEEIDPDSLETLRAFPIDPPLAAAIYTVACSREGALLAVGSKDGTVVLFDAANGSVRWRNRQAGESTDLRALAFTARGDSLAVCGNGIVALLDATTGRERWRVSTGTSAPRAMAFVSNDRELVVGHLDESLVRFDAGTGARLATVHGAHSQTWSIAAAPDGRSFAVGSFNAKASIFASDADSDIRSVTLDGSAVQGISVGRRTLAVTADGALFEIVGNTQRRIALDGRALAVHESFDGTIFVGLESGFVELGPEDRAARAVATGSPVTRIGSIDEGRVVLARLADGTHAAFDRQSGAERWSQRELQRLARVALETGRPGTLLLPRDWPAATTAVDLRTGAESDPRISNEFPTVGALAPDRRTIALGTIEADAEVAILDAVSFKTLLRFPNHRRPVQAVAWSPDGSRIASASLDGTVRVWHVARGIEILTAWRGDCNDLAFDARGRLWLACADGLLRVIDGSPPDRP